MSSIGSLTSVVTGSSATPTYADIRIGRLMPSPELCRVVAGIARGCWGWLLNPRHNPVV